MAVENYKHLLLRIQADTGKYTNPSSFKPSEEFLKNRIKIVSSRVEQGEGLISDLEKAEAELLEQLNQEDKDSLEFQPGIKITFESWEGFELKFESLEDARAKIEILSVKEVDNKFFTTIRIPEGKLEVFIKKIQDYLDPNKDTKKGKPSNLELIANIEKIKLSALENFWSDSELFPQDLEQKLFLEAWLRVGDNRELIIKRFKEQAKKADIFISENPLNFPETTVFLIRASMNQLKQSVLILDCISEIRIYKDTPSSFLEMQPFEEKEWVENLQDRISYADNHKEIAICILDTGVNYSHPLLKESISETEADSYNPNWGKSDHAGHNRNGWTCALWRFISFA